MQGAALGSWQSPVLLQAGGWMNQGFRSNGWWEGKHDPAMHTCSLGSQSCTEQYQQEGRVEWEQWEEQLCTHQRKWMS